MGLNYKDDLKHIILCIFKLLKFSKEIKITERC